MSRLPAVRRTCAALAAVPLLLGLVACGDDEPTAPGRGADPAGGTEPSLEDPVPPAPPSGSTPSTVPDATGELAQHDGRPCPEQLPQTAGSGAAASPAEAGPDVPGPDRAWVCGYELTEDGAGWDRVGPVHAVDETDLDDITREVAALRPSPARLCTKELGARDLLVLDTDGDLTGVLFDTFGCEDVRLTDDPHRTPAGASTAPGVVPGLLEASPGFALDVQRWVRAHWVE